MDFDFENYEENFDNNGNNGNDGNAEKQNSYITKFFFCHLRKVKFNFFRRIISF